MTTSHIDIALDNACKAPLVWEAYVQCTEVPGLVMKICQFLLIEYPSPYYLDIICEELHYFQEMVRNCRPGIVELERHLGSLCGCGLAPPPDWPLTWQTKGPRPVSASGRLLELAQVLLHRVFRCTNPQAAEWQEAVYSFDPDEITRDADGFRAALRAKPRLEFYLPNEDVIEAVLNDAHDEIRAIRFHENRCRRPSLKDGPCDEPPYSFRWQGRTHEWGDSYAYLHRVLVIAWPHLQRGYVRREEFPIDRDRTLSGYCTRLNALLREAGFDRELSLRAGFVRWDKPTT